MAAGFAFSTRYALGDGFRVDLVLPAAVLTGDLHNPRFGRRRCLRGTRRRRLRRTLTQWDRVSTGLAFGGGYAGWNLARIHIIDFVAFRTDDLHGRLPDSIILPANGPTY